MPSKPRPLQHGLAAVYCILTPRRGEALALCIWISLISGSPKGQTRIRILWRIVGMATRQRCASHAFGHPGHLKRSRRNDWQMFGRRAFTGFIVFDAPGNTNKKTRGPRRPQGAPKGP